MTARKLNNELKRLKVQYFQNDTYLLYANYRGKGYEIYKTHPYINSKGEAQTARHLYWTETGRKFIYSLFAKGGAV